MTNLFSKRAAIFVSVAFVSLTAFAVFAKRSPEKKPDLLPALSMTARIPHLPQNTPWQKELSISKTKVRKEKIVQTLKTGAQVTYTLQPDLQQEATELLKHYDVPFGGMVMLEIATGNVLVMAGYSHSDPKATIEKLTLTPWAPAASVYKLVTAAALLEYGIPANTTVCYHGGLSGLQNHNIEDNPRRDKTCHTLSDAIAKSINPIMGKLAIKYLSPNQMISISKRFGFNRDLYFPIPVQQSRANIPQDRLTRAQVAAGFWHTEISVLHGALIASIVANKGTLKWPRLIESIRLPYGQVVTPQVPSSEKALNNSIASKLAKMMEGTITHGTGRRGFFTRRGRRYLPHVSVAGKTGSLSQNNLHFNWFVGFAPADNPKVAFSVLLGNPPRWRIKATTAAREILSDYIKWEASSKSAMASR